MPAQLELEARAFAQQVASGDEDVLTVWLIGSRANGTSTPSSDWDFLVFGSEGTLARLRNSTALQRDGTDLLVVTNNNEFEGTWGTAKTGSLLQWEWRQLSEAEAEYMAAKWVEREDGSNMVLSRKRAIRVWP